MVKRNREVKRERPERPIKLYTSADEYQLAKASFNHGLYRKGIWHLRNASHGGHVLSQLELGSWLEAGTSSVLSDVNEALYWYSQAAQSGNDFALFRLGLCYYHGIGTLRDMKTAIEFFSYTSYLDAKFLLAVCFAKGTFKDPNACLYWCNYAAKRGHAQGNFYLKYLLN